MKRFVQYFLLLLLTSCSYKVIPLKNDYPTGTYEIKSPSNFETVWGNIIEMFAKNGIGVKLIDKASGFIVAQNTAAPVTTEDKNGKLLNTKAWVVSEKIFDPGPKQYYYPKEATVEWNIYIKSDGNTGTLININMISASVTSTYYASGNVITTSDKSIKTSVRSTQVFEKAIADKIK